MDLITAATVTSSAPPAAFFDAWSDTNTHLRWSPDIAWMRLDGPFTQGVTGSLKPKGGPIVRFSVPTLTDTDYDNASRLPGARLLFAHHVRTVGDHTEITANVSITGPLRWFWRATVARNLPTSVPRDLAAMVQVVESRLALTS